jgi:uroporphyrinogen-III synthase
MEMKILITRAKEHADRTAKRLKTSGHDAVQLPLMAFKAVENTIPAAAYDATILTSEAGADFLGRHIAANCSFRNLLDLPVCCVGDQTAAAAKHAGFRDVHIAGGNARMLAGMVQDKFNTVPPREAVILYACAHDKACNLAEIIPEHDIVEVIMYKAELLDPGFDLLKKNIECIAQGAVFLYSVRTARHLFTLAEKYGLLSSLLNLTLIAISENVQQTVPEWMRQRVYVAKSPDEHHMIAMLEQVTVPRSKDPGPV